MSGDAIIRAHDGVRVRMSVEAAVFAGERWRVESVPDPPRLIRNLVDGYALLLQGKRWFVVVSRSWGESSDGLRSCGSRAGSVSAKRIWRKFPRRTFLELPRATSETREQGAMSRWLEQARVPRGDRGNTLQARASGGREPARTGCAVRSQFGVDQGVERVEYDPVGVVFGWAARKVRITLPIERRSLGRYRQVP